MCRGDFNAFLCKKPVEGTANQRLLKQAIGGLWRRNRSNYACKNTKNENSTLEWALVAMERV